MRKSKSAETPSELVARAGEEHGNAYKRIRQFQRARGLLAPEQLPTSPQSPPRPAIRAQRAALANEAVPASNSPILNAYRFRQDQGGSATAQARAVAPVPNDWRPLGPFGIPHGQSYGYGGNDRPAVSGRIAAIAVDPSNDQHILIGAGGGGVWETSDGGENWQPRTDAMPSLSIGAIAFDPTNPQIVYAATGEGNSLFGYLGVGIYQSSDGGATWSELDPSPENPLIGFGFFDLVVDPLDSQHLLAGAAHVADYQSQGVLLESTDGGRQWQVRRHHTAWQIALQPAAAVTAPAVREIFAACEDGLFRSQDNGASWQRVTLPDPPAFAVTNGLEIWQRLAVCHAPSDGNVLYVFGSPLFDPIPYLWQGDLRSGTFRRIVLPQDLSAGQAWYDWFAAVAPDNAEAIYLGAIDLHKGVKAADGLWHWNNLSARVGQGDSIHPDQHAIAFSSTDPNTVYIGNDGGLYCSNDGGQSWRALNRGLAITEIEYIAQHPWYETYLLAGTQDNGTLRYEGEEIWYHVQDGDGGDCGVNANNPAICYHTFYGMGMERSLRGGGWNHWEWIGPEITSSYNALFYPPLEVQNDMVVQAGKSVFVSNDTGTTWTEIPLPALFPGYHPPVSAIAIESPIRLYVGTTTGNLFCLNFLYDSWQPATILSSPITPNEGNSYISDIVVDPTNPARLWVTLSHARLWSGLPAPHLFRSDDGGLSWQAANAGLPDIAVNAIEIDPLTPTTLWVATDSAVWRTLNEGVTWSEFGSGLPNALIHDLVLQPITRLLRAATQSRGVWEISVDPLEIPSVQIYVRDHAVDSGGPPLFGPSMLPNPFDPTEFCHWFQCSDLKVDVPPFHSATTADMNFERFEDDHGVAAAGLRHNRVMPGQSVRVYVQVHNRGLLPATDVVVKVFYAEASIGFPDLPADFWSNFPNNTLPATSPWQEVAPHKVLALVDSRRGEIVGFDWTVPAIQCSHVTLLTIISSTEDPIDTQERQVSALVRGDNKCGINNLITVKLSPAMGAEVQALRVNLWAAAGLQTYRLRRDQEIDNRVLLGVMVSNRLSAYAHEVGLGQLTLDSNEQAKLQLLLSQWPDLVGILDLNHIYRLPSPRLMGGLAPFTLNPQQPEPVILVLKPNPTEGQVSLFQVARDQNGNELETGGVTIQVVT